MKPLDEARLLMDITTRQQMYIEGVKLGQRREFERVLRELSDEFRLVLGKLKFATLDQMTKMELNVLLLTIRRFQSRIYSQYSERLIKQLQAFMRADVKQNKRIIGYAKLQFNFEEYDKSLPKLNNETASKLVIEEKEDENLTPLFGLLAINGTDEGFSKFWSTIINNPIPASGALILPFIKSFLNTSQASLENTIRQGYSNGWTPQETISEIVGISGGEKGKLNTVLNNNDAVVATAIQVIAAAGSAAVSSAMFEYYVWLSVMDNRTTVICRSRNQKVYKYGVGPMPPAHIRCRSHIMPLHGGKLDDRIDTSFYNWASQQPLAFLVSVFGTTVAASYKNGTASEKDKNGFTAVRPLTIQEFEEMDDLILLQGD